MPLKVKVRPDDARPAFRDQSEERAIGGGETPAFLEDAGNLPFKEGKEDVQQKDHPEDDGGIFQRVENHIPHTGDTILVFRFLARFFLYGRKEGGKPRQSRPKTLDYFQNSGALP